MISKPSYSVKLHYKYKKNSKILELLGNLPIGTYWCRYTHNPKYFGESYIGLIYSRYLDQYIIIFAHQNYHHWFPTVENHYFFKTDVEAFLANARIITIKEKLSR